MLWQISCCCCFLLYPLAVYTRLLFSTPAFLSHLSCDQFCAQGIALIAHAAGHLARKLWPAADYNTGSNAEASNKLLLVKCSNKQSNRRSPGCSDRQDAAGLAPQGGKPLGEKNISSRCMHPVKSRSHYYPNHKDSLAASLFHTGFTSPCPPPSKLSRCHRARQVLLRDAEGSRSPESY